MSKLRNFILLPVALFALITLARAAVTPIADTPYSSRSGAGTSTSDGSHTSTYSGVQCVYPYADSADQCRALLGVDDIEFEICDGGKYNCACRSTYNLTCDGPNEMPKEPGCGLAGSKKYSSCLNASQSCANLMTAYGNQGELKDTAAECQNFMGRSYTMKAVICNESGTNKYFCPYPPCSTLETKTFSAASTDASLTDQGGSQEGICYDTAAGNARKYPWYCNATKFPFETEEEVGCAVLLKPQTCNLEYTPKYGLPCEYLPCGDTDRTAINEGMWITCPAVTSEIKSACSLPDDTFTFVCKCPTDNTYPYTQTSCALEAAENGDSRPHHAAPLVDSPDDYCLWDAQKTIDPATGLSLTYYPDKVRFSLCAPECPSGVTASATSCTGGAVLTPCSIANTGTDKDLNPYLALNYCACPKDNQGNDLYHTSCPSGQVPGGRVCTYENGQAKYELCLPICDNNSPKKTTAEPSAANCNNISQGDDNYGKYVCSDDGTAKVTCTDATKQCCLSDGTTLSNCSDSFIIMGDGRTNTEACLPYSEVLPRQLCLPFSKAVNASWQCSCLNYFSEAECAAEGATGNGNTCTLDGSSTEELIKYEKCTMPCQAGKIIKDTFAECKYNSTATSAYADLCYDTVTKVDRYQCNCPPNFQTLDQYCASAHGSDAAAVAKCKTDMVGFGDICNFDLPTVSSDMTPIPLKKYQFFGKACPTNNNLTIVSSATSCVQNVSEECYNSSDSDPKTTQFLCKCPSGWKSIEEDCAAKYPADETAKADCIANSIGIGTACKYEVKDPADASSPVVEKFASIGAMCPLESKRPTVSKASECIIGEETLVSTPCYTENNSGTSRFLCSCPASYVTECIGDDEGKIPAGTVCEFDGFENKKYEGCFKQCKSTAQTPVVADPGDCPMVNGVIPDTEQCYMKAGDTQVSYACRCPRTQNYQTLDEFCATMTPQDGEDQAAATARCKNEYVGVGAPCTYDVDENGLSLQKYVSFDRVCPTDRPLFMSAEECTAGVLNGVLDGTCHVKAGDTQERYLCKCPTTFVDTCGTPGADGTIIPDPAKETAGKTCNYEGDAKLKYEGCFTRCDTISAHGIEYMEDEDASEFDCQNKLGDGAVFGVSGDGSQCSKNHTLLNPCYCKNTDEQCLFSEDKRPADNAKACTISGTTYYDQCVNADCAEPGSATAVIDIAESETRPADEICKASFGQGATGKLCGSGKVQCDCDTRNYFETCEYPLEPPADLNNHCKWSENGNMSTSSKPHYPAASCKVKPNLALCGQNVLNPNGSNMTGITIFVTATEGECRSRYGTGARTQLCEYENDYNKRAYNCYYDPARFTAVEDTCPIRHVLGGEYIIINGVKRYESCVCHQAYKNHKYNCAGMLSGGACTQTLTSSLINADPTLRDAGVSAGSSLAYYPYCACTADYKYECDGERNIGVGQPCNGKYTECVCKPDELPENWADNYYGCPGGKAPTGVTKPNGCGGRYYQCSVTECTWQHTEKCQSPLIGIDPCQDNLGNIGGYKSCKCPGDYTQVCADQGKTGVGEPCILNGKYYYTQCEDIAKCVHGENLTCQGEFQIGVNPCDRNGVTYFQYCACGSGYDKLCADGEVGVGPSCKLEGKEFFAKCEKPTGACTANHKEACDYNQESYDPCVNSENKLLYKCRCPANFKKCANGPASGAPSCTDPDRGTLYRECSVENECSYEQDKNYKICTNAQKGVGGSCVKTTVSESGAETQIIKYAQCEDTDACRVNGYQYTCLGYTLDPGADSCKDANGNLLYKECKCPSNYIPCPEKNNTKGKQCVPLLENGTSGTTVYETCSCDPSRFRYNCLPDEVNQGIIPAQSKSCTPRTYTQGSQNQYETGDKMYESCDCSQLYTQTCKANGQFGDDTNYCEKIPGGQRFYKSCQCKPEFTLDCKPDAANPGMTAPPGATQVCIPIAEGGAEEAPKYSSCECGQYYTLDCNGVNQLQSETDFCLVNDGAVQVKKYRSCACDETIFFEDCKPKNGNNGILAPSVGDADSCIAIKPDGKGGYIRTSMFKTCRCDASYKYTCTEADKDKVTNATPESYEIDNSDYCASSTSDTTATRYYKSCACSSEFKACGDENNPQIKPNEGAVACQQINADGSTTALYKAEDCQCQPKEKPKDEHSEWGSWFDWYLAKTTDKSSATFKQHVTSLCNYEKNYVSFNDGCGKLYFRCVIDPNTYFFTSDNCKAPYGSDSWTLQGTSSSGNTDLGNITMYTDCECPPNTYFKTQDDCNNYNIKPNETRDEDMKKGDLFCRSQERHSHKWACEAGGVNLSTTNGTGCIFRSDGVRRYIGCKCKTSGTGVRNNCSNCDGSGDTECVEIQQDGKGTCISVRCN